VSKCTITLDRLWKRDKKICWLCGLFCPRAEATRDHVIPLAWGGTNEQANIRLAHKKCNEERGCELPQEPVPPVPLMVWDMDRQAFARLAVGPQHGQQNKRRRHIRRMNEDG
jgi:hypothetical protein